MKYLLSGTKYFWLILALTPQFVLAQTNPNLTYATYLGSIGDQSGGHSANSPDGTIIVFSSTGDAADLASPGAFMTEPQGWFDCWLTKITLNGDVIWSTYFGGLSNDAARHMECDALGNIYIAGESLSSDLPTTSGAFQDSTLSVSAPFLAKFNTNGELVWCTYFDTPGGGETVIDLEWSESDQRLYALGQGFKTGLATPGAYYNYTGTGTASLLAAFNPDGSLIYTTYWSWQIIPTCLDTDANGKVYIAFMTNDLIDINFEGAYKPVNEGHDGLLILLDDAGWPIWGTYVGGEGSDSIETIVCGADGSVYCAGMTDSNTGIATSGAYQSTLVGSHDGLLVKITPDLQLAWSTYFGTNNGWERITEVFWGADDYLYFRMNTNIAAVLDVTPDAFQAAPGGGFNDQILARVTEEGTFQWVSFLGGNGLDTVEDMYVVPNGGLIVTGYTSSTNYYATDGAVQPFLEGTLNIFLMRFDPPYCIFGCNHQEAFNYNPLATCDDGTCLFSQGYDINGDGVVDIQDLLEIMNEFGCIADCFGDLDGDGIVGMQDVILMIGEL